MTLTNRRPFKALASAALITLGLGFFLLECFRRNSDHQRIFDNLNTAVGSSPATLIPEKLWYKVGPRGINNETREWINTCLEQNPTFEHQIMTDSSGDAFVINKFGHRPDIVETYLALSVPIVKADLLRYLLLFSEGGIWSDLDVSCGQYVIGYQKNTRIMPVS